MFLTLSYYRPNQTRECFKKGIRENFDPSQKICIGSVCLTEEHLDILVKIKEGKLCVGGNNCVDANQLNILNGGTRIRLANGQRGDRGGLQASTKGVKYGRDDQSATDQAEVMWQVNTTPMYKI
jgi:hypothetical protein